MSATLYPAECLTRPLGPSGPWDQPCLYAERAISQPQRDYAGRYQITGTVQEAGTPGRYRVLLLCRRSHRVLRETWSGADGSYAFTALAEHPGGYLLLAYDHGADPTNAAVADRVSAEPMPPELIPPEPTP